MDDNSLREDMVDASYERQSRDADESLILMGVCAFLLVMALLAGAHWLDGEFHWHLTQWIRSHTGLS